MGKVQTYFWGRLVTHLGYSVSEKTASMQLFHWYDVSRFGNILCKIILNMPFNEFTTSFRLYNRNCIKILNNSSLKSNDYSSQIELFFYVYQSNLKCIEIPIHFKDRFKGKSKIPKFQIIYGLVKLLNLFLKKLFK